MASLREFETVLNPTCPRLRHFPTYPVKKPLEIFLAWAFLAWGLARAISVFTWSPHWKEYPNPFAAIVGVLALIWGTRSALRRDGRSLADLGLDLGLPHLRAFGFALVIGTSVTLLTTLVVTLISKPRWETGAISWGYAASATHAFFWAALFEELLFRGYLLRRLIEWWGQPSALVAVALAFGLFHLPGLSGWTAVKMVCTTGASSLLFSALLLRSGSLWSAVAAHFSMNLVLHPLLGEAHETTSFFHAVFPLNPPLKFDVGFWSLLLIIIGSALVLFRKARGARVGENAVAMPSS
jgi:membrane protease YdiL (CAAX protease family)